jgi:hypothetical protein
MNRNWRPQSDDVSGMLDSLPEKEETTWVQ